MKLCLLQETSAKGQSSVNIVIAPFSFLPFFAHKIIEISPTSKVLFKKSSSDRKPSQKLS